MPYRDILPSGGDTGTAINLRKRLALVERQVALKGTRVIDCGCGAGQYVLEFLARGADAHGIEYESRKVDQYKQGNPQLADRVQVGSIESTGLPSDDFDVALLNEVLEHVPDDDRALREVLRVLKPGGTLVVFSPNRCYPFETHGVKLKGSGRKLPIYIPLIPYVPVKVGERVFEYVARNYWPSTLRKQVREAGFEIVGTDYVWQTFENISGRQPALVRMLRPMLRSASATLERTPVIRALGVSQVIVARKPS